MVEGTFHVAAKDCQEPHVAEQMKPIAVHEHGREQREEDGEGTGGLRNCDGHFTKLRLLHAFFKPDLVGHPRLHPLRLGQVRESADLFRYQTEPPGERISKETLAAINYDV